MNVSKTHQNLSSGRREGQGQEGEDQQEAEEVEEEAEQEGKEEEGQGLDPGQDHRGENIFCSSDVC